MLKRDPLQNWSQMSSLCLGNSDCWSVLIPWYSVLSPHLKPAHTNMTLEVKFRLRANFLKRSWMRVVQFGIEFKYVTIFDHSLFLKFLERTFVFTAWKSIVRFKKSNLPWFVHDQKLQVGQFCPPKFA